MKYGMILPGGTAPEQVEQAVLAESREEVDLRTRAAMMDEGIDLMRELWSGRLSYHGQYYDFESEQADVLKIGRPVQEKIPVWVVGVWPRPKSMRRVLRCDGVLPQYSGGEGTPAELRALRTWLEEHGAPSDLDVIAEGETPADDPTAAAAQVAAWADAGPPR